MKGMMSQVSKNKDITIVDFKPPKTVNKWIQLLKDYELQEEVSDSYWESIKCEPLSMEQIIAIYFLIYDIKTAKEKIATLEHDWSDEIKEIMKNDP